MELTKISFSVSDFATGEYFAEMGTGLKVDVLSTNLPDKNKKIAVSVPVNDSECIIKQVSENELYLVLKPETVTFFCNLFIDAESKTGTGFKTCHLSHDKEECLKYSQETGYIETVSFEAVI